jgi:hypothetical protein
MGFVSDGNVDSQLDEADAGSSTGPGDGSPYRSSSRTTMGFRGLQIPVRYPGREYDPSGAGSVNALEQGLSSVSGTIQWHDPDSASVAINGWSEDDQRAIARKMWSLGLLASPQDLAGAYQQWDRAVAIAARAAAGGNPMEVQDAMEMMADGSPDAIKQRRANALAGRTITTQKVNPFNPLDPGDAKQLVTAAFQAKVGRDPSDAELKSMIGSLNAAMKAHPGTQSVTTEYDEFGGIASQQQSPVTGAIDPGQFVSEATADDPEAASYMGANTYFSALMGLVNGG